MIRIRMLCSTVLLVVACFTFAGCLDEAKQQSAAMTEQVNALNAQLQNVVSQKAELEKALADLKAQGTDPGAVATMEAKLKSITDKATKIADQVNAGVAQLNELNASIQAAKTEAEATAAAIRGGAHIAAPFAGPYAPFVEIGGGLLASIVAGIWGHKKGVQSGVTGTAAPIEAARNDALEAKLKTETGVEYLVVEKAGADIGHKANGVSAAIAKATS